MIKFFRKIRQQLLSQNRFSKYLVYAIGEIVLVMVGILLALQVNNWNEQKKAIKHEKATVANLKLEFQKNLNTLNRSITNLQGVIQATNVLLNNTGPDYEIGTLKNVDSVIRMTMRMSVWDPSQYTLNTIKNSDILSSLSSDSLKVKLIEWDSFYSNLLDWGDFYVSGGQKYFDFLINNSSYRNISLNAALVNTRTKFESSNEQLLTSQLFENYLTDRATINFFMLRYYQEAVVYLTDIIDLCQNY